MWNPYSAIKGASKTNKLGHTDMREIANTEELIFKIQKFSIGINCELKPRRMNIKPTPRDHTSKQKTIFSIG